jgi:hypothetical protein
MVICPLAYRGAARDSTRTELVIRVPGLNENQFIETSDLTI